MSETPETGEGPADELGGSTGRTVFETTPTIRPTLIWFGITTAIGGGVLIYLVANPELFGERQLTDIVFWVLFLLFGAILLRFGIKMFILTRTNYVVTTDDIRREYELVYRRHARELPIEKIRGVQFTQSRIQSLLGYGTLSFLAGGTDQSLGFVEFENLKQPHEARDRIRKLVARRAGSD